MGNYTIFQMFENPRRGRQTRNFTTNVPKILDLKSCSEQIFFRKLSLGAPRDFEIVCEFVLAGFFRFVKFTQNIGLPVIQCFENLYSYRPYSHSVCRSFLQSNQSSADFRSQSPDLQRFLLLSYKSFRGSQRQFSENICSEDDLRSRIFGTFFV